MCNGSSIPVLLCRIVVKASNSYAITILLFYAIPMYWSYTLRALFESDMFSEYKYWPRNRCGYIVIAKCINSWWLMELVHLRRCHRTMHAAGRNNYTGHFLHGMQCLVPSQRYMSGAGNQGEKNRMRSERIIADRQRNSTLTHCSYSLTNHWGRSILHTAHVFLDPPRGALFKTLTTGMILNGPDCQNRLRPRWKVKVSWWTHIFLGNSSYAITIWC